MSERQQIKPAALQAIIDNLFQNQKYHTRDNVQYKQTFSRLSLTDSQKEKIVYPSGYTPLDFFVIYQTDKYADRTFVSSELSMVSFMKRANDGYIYGHYFAVSNQGRYRTEVLKHSTGPVTLSENASLVPSQYIEVYNDINGSTVILSLSTVSDNQYATLQYSNKGRYVYQQLRTGGLEIFNGDDALLTGLSKNLKN